MSSNLPQPQGPRPSRAPAITVFSASAAVGALVWVGAPWWAVALAISLAVLVPGIILFTQAVMPEDSAHKRDVLLEVLRHRERRARRARVPRQSRGPSTEETRTGAEQDRQPS